MSLSLAMMLDENGVQVPTYDANGNVLMYRAEDDCYVYVPLSKELLEAYPQLLVVETAMAMDTTTDDDLKHKTHWTYEATIMLINKYGAHYSLFADNIHKNTEIWDKIAAEFRVDGYSFCSAQCENRWKYIRAKYIKKKDNGAANSTGEPLYEFEFFKEIDAILGKKPNVVPKHVASSEKPQNPKGNGNTKSPLIPSKGKKTPNRSSTTSTVTSASATMQSTRANSGPLTTSTVSNAGHNIRKPATVDLTANSVTSASTNSPAPANAATASSQSRRRTAPSKAATASSQSRRRLSYDDEGFSSVQSFFSDNGDDEEEASPPQDENSKSRRKEPWEENVQRQERYHADMMSIQRESLDVLKDIMSQVLDCFRNN